VDKFSNKTAKQKLSYLQKHSSKIPRHSKKEFRLRMQGVTQSYDAFDSIIFKRVKAVREILKDNPQYSLDMEQEK
jgi:hypothetical protein